MFADDLHAKRVASLTNAAVGVLEGAALGIHAIGRALAFAAGLESRHAVKQLDRLLSMGIDWESEELVAHLIGQTGQRANLVSVTCDEVLCALAASERSIRREHVDKVLAGNRIRDELVGWSNLGPNAEESRLDRMAVYASVRQDRFTLADVLQRLERGGHRADPE